MMADEFKYGYKKSELINGFDELANFIKEHHNNFEVQDDGLCYSTVFNGTQIRLNINDKEFFVDSVVISTGMIIGVSFVNTDFIILFKPLSKETIVVFNTTQSSNIDFFERLGFSDRQ